MFVVECFVSGYMHGVAVAALKPEVKAKAMLPDREEKESAHISVAAPKTTPSLADEMASLAVTSDKWGHIGEVNESWLPGKDTSTGGLFAMV